MNPIRSSGLRGEGEPAAGIIAYFRRRLEQCGDARAYRRTGSGAWAASRPEHLFRFFQEMNLSGFGLLIDLGSGDGVACCVASLFTRAIGIESDRLLAAGAERAARDLKLQGRVGFICADFLTQRIERADCLYIYPDKPLDAVENLLEGWGGTLLVYGPHFPPRRLSLRRKLKCGMETMSIYSRCLE